MAAEATGDGREVGGGGWTLSVRQHLCEKDENR
jgi:hypothetical protein